MERDMWNPDTDSLLLLDTLGSPFSTGAFRSAVVATAPGWRDVSFGARAADGVSAAVALLARRRGAESVPPAGYGGVVASRELTPAETLSFFELASRELRLRRVWIRWLQLEGVSAVGKTFATADVVPITPDEPPGARYSRLARRSLKRAAESGATVTASSSADVFWPIYASAAKGWPMRYPEPLVRRLVETGAARVHAVSVEDRAVSVLLTLVTGSHWMCWLAAQTEEGRAIAASYLAYDALFAEARAAGVRAVNLGASVGGGSEFKRRLGATDAVMRQWVHESPAAAAARFADQVASAAISRARSMLERTG